MNMNQFQKDIDEWIKEIKSDLSLVPQLSKANDENVAYIQNNYELIEELKYDLNELKSELKAIKILQIVLIKQMQQTEKDKGE